MDQTPFCLLGWPLNVLQTVLFRRNMPGIVKKRSQWKRLLLKRLLTAQAAAQLKLAWESSLFAFLVHFLTSCMSGKGSPSYSLIYARPRLWRLLLLKKALYSRLKNTFSAWAFQLTWRQAHLSMWIWVGATNATAPSYLNARLQIQGKVLKVK